jgi:Alginate export
MEIATIAKLPLGALSLLWAACASAQSTVNPPALPPSQTATPLAPPPQPAGIILPLSDDLRLTVHGEYRVRFEHQDAVDFGIDGARESDSLAHRLLLDGDLRHTSGARLFVQFSNTDETGRRPGPRPFDRSDPDIAQAYVDLPISLGEARLTLRGGRQELNLNNRLLGLRDGATLRRAFDGVRADLAVEGATLTAFVLQPVRNQPGAFDDDQIPGEHFTGVSLALPGTPAQGQWSVYAFHRERRRATFVDAVGRDQRTTIGYRFAQATPHWDVTTQAALQFGETAGQRVRAGAAYIDAGWHPDGTAFPRIGAQIGAASGDRRRGDGQVNSFDPLYPNLGAYTDAPLYFYSNQLIGQVNATQRWGRLTVKLDATYLSRVSRADGVYATPGRIIVVPDGGRLASGALLEASARWAITPRIELYGSLLHATTTGGLAASGGRPVDFALLQITVRL